MTGALPLVLAMLGSAAASGGANPERCLAEDKRPVALILGDSNIYGSLGTELERSLQALGYRTDRFGRSGSGLARPDYFDWFAEAPALIEEADPDVVFFMCGGNDGQGLMPRTPQQRRITYDDDEAWEAEYSARVIELASLLGDVIRPVYFLSPTNRRPKSARERMGRVRRVQAAALDYLDTAWWIDMFPLTTDAAGRYLWRERDDQGHMQQLRSADGVHLTKTGGKVVGARLARELVAGGLPIFGTECPAVARLGVMPLAGRQHPGRAPRAVVPPLPRQRPAKLKARRE
ncbi:MAG: DUF459 domain-containing protein [Myxococcota bacterium]